MLAIIITILSIIKQSKIFKCYAVKQQKKLDKN